MIIDGIASLLLSSRERSVGHITDLLGLDPASYSGLGDRI
jgi:hypothetical protein